MFLQNGYIFGFVYNSFGYIMAKITNEIAIGSF